MRGIAGDEYASHLIAIGDGDAQIPKPHVVEIADEREARGFVQQRQEIVIVLRGIGRHRRMKEPALADVDAAEELPVPLQIGVQHAIGGARRKALEFLVQVARAEQRQHHDLVEIRAAALDPDLPPHDGMTAVAADHVVGFDDLARHAALLGGGDADAAVVLLDLFGGPAEAGRRPRRAAPIVRAARLRRDIAAAVRSPRNNRN